MFHVQPACSMKITEDVRNYAAEQGIADDEALKRGMSKKAEEFSASGAGFVREGVGLSNPQAEGPKKCPQASK